MKSRDLLVIRELVRIQQALLEGRIRQPLRRMLHYIEDQANSLLREGGDQIIVTRLLPVDAMQPETALGQHK